MEILLVIIFLLIGIPIYFAQKESHISRIEAHVASMGGVVKGYERKNFVSGLGPFMVVGKGRTVYQIEYEINGLKREGWVRFGGIGGPDWRF